MTDEHLDRLRAMVEPNQQTWDLSPDDVAAIRATLAEVERLREEWDVALRMFSKCRWNGSLDMTNAWHVERGRRMAGLKAEAGGVSHQETNT